MIVVDASGALYFDLRLWNADDFVAALQDCYSRLPADVQAELLLKQVWTLVLEE